MPAGRCSRISSCAPPRGPRTAGRPSARGPRPAARQSWCSGPVLVDALPDDKDVDAAWQAATVTGAHDQQWRTLADALSVYLRLAEPLTKQTGNTVYEQLVGLLLSIRDCHRRLDTEDEFARYVTALRTAQKRKRNLMRLMDEHDL